MNQKIKNRIIAISGEPVSGKGTTIKELIKTLKNEVIDENNIHLISTGTMFRDYFEKIIEFIKNAQNTEKLKELAKDEKMQQIINNRKYRKALENTIMNINKNGINLNDVEKISELNNSEVFKEMREVIDFLIDNGTKTLGETINSKPRPNEIWIFDSRMAFANIPNSFSVRLTTDATEAGRRLFEDSSRGNEDKYKTLEEAIQAREERRLGEIERYKAKYGVDLEKEENYNLIINTSNLTVNEVANKILDEEKKYRKSQDFSIENR